MNTIIEKRLSGRHKKWMQLIDDLENKDVLDVGCSYGWFEDFALKSSCKRIVAIEPNKKNFSEAQEYVPEAEYLEGSVFEIPFEPETFDTVAFFDVIEHIPRNTEPKALKEINRVLKSKGVLYLSTPHRSILSNSLDPAWYLGHRHYSRAKLVGLLKEAGFKVEWVDFGGGTFSQLYMILFYIYKFLFRKEMNLFKTFFERKREEEYLDGNGFTTIFIKAHKL